MKDERKVERLPDGSVNPFSAILSVVEVGRKRLKRTAGTMMLNASADDSP
jgi:hypothetical protein